MIRVILAGLVLFLIATFPATWLLMLFLGNVGTNLSYWGSLPGGVLLAMLISGAASPSSSSRRI